jgi:DNA polymerase III alpha subunit/very-short-patch-repair endonuclease
MPEFVHLHCHTQYSLLDGAAEIGTMMDKALADGQKGVALTDHGNMFGAFKFVNEASKRGLKPMVGCEFYLVEDRHKKSFSRAAGERDVRYHQLMLAKNKEGYINLSKLCSLGYIQGLYGKYPRIDKELIEQHHEGLIVTSCCIGAEVPQLLLQGKDEAAEEALKWWLNLFGEDYYIELQRHRGLEDIDGLGVSQEDINQKLLALARKHNVKVICTNDSHYVEEEDYMPHDILLCVNTGSLLEDTSRFKFPSSDFYFKQQIEMANLFADVPESVANTMEIYDKIDTLELASDVLLPNFPMPAEFATQDEYLRHLTYEGAKKRYGEITEVVRERLDFELEVIKGSGYPGYFLIVQDFTTAARQMGVSVGPGRGSAAGSAVAYCVGITNVDPIKYDLLFERFLNPERISMPDIDIDFDDVGRQKVIDYVIDKYGQEQVAQIITYGTMAAKSSLRDVGRVMDVPLSEVDRVAKAFPTQLGASLNHVLAEGDIHPKLKGKLNGEDVDRAYKFREMADAPDQIGEMIRTAKKLEGSIRNTGIHACGVVITPSNITEHVPVTADKDTGMYVSQFDNSVAEDAGLLKMDFLGLKTLTIIKDALRMIKENHGVDIDVDELPLDDEKTYELFQRGETNGIFQYESGGMQKHMKNLKPTSFDDLIAMNALYRPGPLEYIPEFIDRKHGRKPIVYDLDAMEEYLHETYGICVTGDTLVHDAVTGRQVRIDQLEDQVGNFLCQGVDHNYQATTGWLTHWVCNGVKPVFEVTLRSGKKVKMTDNHRILTEDGWKALEQLSEGDFIGTPAALMAYPTPGPSPGGRGEAASIASESRETSLALANGERMGAGVVTQNYWEVDTAVTQTVYAHAKAMRKAPTEAERILWSALRGKKVAGYRFHRQKPMGDCIPDFVNVEKRLIIEVDGGYHALPDVIIADQAREKKFTDVGYTILRFTNEQVENALPEVLRSIAKTVKALPSRPVKFPTEIYQVDRRTVPLPSGEGLGVGSPPTRDVRWDEIVSIQPAGEELVYDISVEGIHNFVGNNVLLHNCVYQEQVMLLSQKIANFTKGQADTLRKAMGKKKKAVLDKMYPEFIEGGKANGHPEDKLGKIWKDWEAFASYAFNKSHSTCYALVAYHTAYLKAHYPAEYVASVLTHNKSDQTKMSFFLRECRRMEVPVLGPDINESQADFSVNKKGAIRIGLTALKGVGEGPVEAILAARQEGEFQSVFNLMQRVEPGTVNKRVLEALVDAGGFDCFEDVHRAQYFAPSEKYDSYLEHVTKYANAYQSQLAAAATSLFGAIQEEVLPEEPKPPAAKEWLLPEKLDREKAVTGIYVSGHPLDGYKLEMDNYVTCSLADLNPQKYGRSTVRLAGMITGDRHLVSKNGNGWGIFELSDYDETIEFKLFGEDYQKHRHILHAGTALFITATYQKKWNSEELELKISDVKLLEGIGREMTEAVILKMAVDQVSEKMVMALDELCQRFPGKQKLRMVFYDREEDMKLRMFSLHRKVDADTDFIKEIDRLGIKYRLEGSRA